MQGRRALGRLLAQGRLGPIGVSCKDHSADLLSIPPMSVPTVSVIMPVHNGARFVARAIASIAAQTCSEWELVVIDDGSTDSTPNILASLHDPRIHVITQIRRGASAARNEGLRRAHGRYVAWLDADDFYTPTALADLSGYLDEHPEVDAVFSDGFFCDENETPLMRLSEHRPGIYTGNILEPLLLTPSIISGIICTMTRRALIVQRELRFDPDLGIGEDWDFWIQVARYARFDYVDCLTCAYRIHQTNSTRTSGRSRRVDDLVRCRMKVLNADWFKDLSLPTRRRFFCDLLVGLLSGKPERQVTILDSVPFRVLPPCTRAEILRLVGTDCVARHTETAFARRCLQQAQETWPMDMKGRAILLLLMVSPPVATLVLQGWKALRSVYLASRGIGRSRPKPVPAALGPLSD